MQHFAALAALVPLVAAHGFVNSPPPREPGEAYKAACGEQPFNQQSSDINGNVQGIFQVVGSDFDASKCNLWLCKGFLLEDNPDNVQSYSLGETIDFDVNIAAPHTGYANVSVVKTSSNSVIGEPLIEFSNYAANAGVQANNSAFSVTLPETLGGDCTTAGDCVLQWFWDAPDIDQTYEACVDFVVGGSGSGSGSGNGGSGATASAPAASAPVADATSAPAADATSAVEAVTASSLGPIYSEIADATSAPSAPEATTTTGAGADDEEECPADEEEDDGADDEEECPADDEEVVDDGDDEAADDEECPADEEEDSGDEYADETASEGSSGPTAAAIDGSSPKPTGSYGNSGSGSSGSGANGSASTVTSYVTVAAETKYVTVTADAPACTQA